MTKNKPVKAKSYWVAPSELSGKGTVTGFVTWFDGSIPVRVLDVSNPDALLEQAIQAAARQAKDGWTLRDLITAALESLGILHPSKRNSKGKGSA